MSTSPNLLVPHIEPNQGQKEVTANEAFDILDRAGNGFLAIALTGDLVLSAEQALRNATIRFTGALGSTATVTLPGTRPRRLSVINDTGQTVRVTYPGSTVTADVPAGGRPTIHGDGADVWLLT